MDSSPRGSRGKRCCTANRRLRRSGLTEAPVAANSEEAAGKPNQQHARRFGNARGEVVSHTAAGACSKVAAPELVVLWRAVRFAPDDVVGHVDFAVAVEIAVETDAGHAEDDVG